MEAALVQRRESVARPELHQKSNRENDPLTAELDAAMRRIGEISMENELLRERIRKKFPLAKGRSKR